MNSQDNIELQNLLSSASQSPTVYRKREMAEEKKFNPNMALDTIRVIYKMIENGVDSENLDKQVVAFMSATLDLDQWITDGGNLPDEWQGKLSKFICGIHNIEYMAQRCPQCAEKSELVIDEH